ncbi:MAG: cytochrome C peroxidase [Saprospiraceae bacterium]|uniref:cytochrome-c peroxidase n=1 Tax=Candidatus Brachybacter algidus TaxID=2982024 RepID=UPI001B6BFEB7|nr:cytochrome c peroxidase [Candidatus Brachybacter algidus]MBP7306356.1 cytochrome C peroxidase [Saprospiraceae bacterium]MBK6371680.1 cytochrome C peroxidase [Candidatus Brachybacter algidus]MBK6448953.1 cytochrome C peroxidase [Candidatus Brachybacter algidus]MBK8604743.1 cytochrome C peroxidase [Candidatus Brachybacter algidus]MBK8843557.1 cytochrome C peroxidase [Candidatus Brachybacter algidus]
MKYHFFLFIFFIFFYVGCTDEGPEDLKGDLEDIAYNPTSYTYKNPPGYPKMEFPANNAPTAEGIDLGRRLFYDPILSRDSSMGCFSCHKQEFAFTDGGATSIGVDGKFGTRSSMSIVDVGYNYKGLFWDGRAANLEDQALLPVEDPVELHSSWPEVEVKLRRSKFYPELFRKAFGIKDKKEITKALAAKAIAQFERTIVTSGKSKYDQFVYQGIGFLTNEESDGLDMFFDKAIGVLPDAQCGHCHNDPMFSTNDFFDNGISGISDPNMFIDKGKGGFTKNVVDIGKFRAPSLRNIMLTAPYMHDGSLKTIEDVLEHYTVGGKPSGRRDPLISQIHVSQEQKDQLLAFLKTLSDPEIVKDTTFSNPFK